MKEDILTTLAFSVCSNKGVYALLLGSGISRNSGIPTGWDIILDLVKKLAIQQKEVEPKDPETWFKNKYQEELNYSSILSQLVLASGERVNLLKDYFEPSEEERENHLKEPTKAHKAIAQLAKDGYLKVVITTNFDRLLETALDDIGVKYQVISNESSIEGATPLIHAPFTILKVNGDYKDCRFKNTEEELSKYPHSIREYISRIIDEFGLITCGWSATWDKALIDIIKSSTNRRYSSFFTYTNTCEESLNELAEFRGGKTLMINDADTFFTELSERVNALETIGRDIPITKDVAIARIKKYIVKSESIILLNDLFEDECAKVIENIKSCDFATQIISPELLKKVLAQTDKDLAILLPMCIETIRWSKKEYEKIVLEILDKLTNTFILPKGSVYPESRLLEYYSRLELLYGIGLACVYYHKFSLLNSIFGIKMSDPVNMSRNKKNILDVLNSEFISKEYLNQHTGLTYKTPLSTILYNRLDVRFKNMMGDDYSSYFAIFEYLLGLYYNYLVSTSHLSVDCIPSGEYFWRKDIYNLNENDIFYSFFKQIEDQKDNADILKQGMFKHSYSKYKEIKDRVDVYIKKIRYRYF